MYINEHGETVYTQEEAIKMRRDINIKDIIHIHGLEEIDTEISYHRSASNFLWQEEKGNWHYDKMIALQADREHIIRNATKWVFGL